MEPPPTPPAPPGSPGMQGVPPLPPAPAGVKKKKGMPRGAKIAIIAGAIALVLVAVIVILLVFLFINVVSKPADIANSYMKALDSGQFSEAFGYLAETTQSEETRSGFESKVRQFEGEIASYNTSSISIRNSAAEITMDITLNDGDSGTWYMYLTKEDGEWRLLSVSESRESDWEE